MRRIVLICAIILVALVIVGGCIQQRSNGKPVLPSQQTVGVVTPRPTIEPQDTIPSSITFFPTSMPHPPVPLNKTIKDPVLNLAINVPENWKGKTIRMNNPEGYEGLGYLTQFTQDTGIPVSNDNEKFSIITYAISRGQDQSFRNYYRDSWIPKPQESTVTINGIIFDKFLSSNGKNTAVAYVTKKASANEKGFASVIYFQVNEEKSTYGINTYEEIAKSFRYLTKKEIDTLSVEEIEIE